MGTLFRNMKIRKSRGDNCKRSVLSAGGWGLGVGRAGAKDCYFFIINNLLKFNFKNFVYILFSFKNHYR